MLFVRGTGPIGYPGGAEVVNMQPPAALIKRGILALPCIGDGRQSGTSGSPSILNASPEAAASGGLAILKTGDQVRIDLNKGSANILISDDGGEEAPRRADGQWRLQASGEPDAVAGDLPQHGRPAIDRRLRWSSPQGIRTSPARLVSPETITNSHVVIASEAKQSRDISRETVWIASSQQCKIAAQFCHEFLAMTSR